MLTHSYNGIMAPLVMRSWDDHTAYWGSYVVVTSSMTPQLTISLSLSRWRVYPRRQTPPSPDLQNMDSLEKSGVGLFGLLFLCFHSVHDHVPPPPMPPLRHETFKDSQPGLNTAVWIGPESNALQRFLAIHNFMCFVSVWRLFII